MIYKPTDLSPSAQTFDVKLSSTDEPIFLECKIDTANTKVDGYTIKVYDSENNLVLSSVPEDVPLDIKYISLIEDLRGYVSSNRWVDSDDDPQLLNSGYNGTYFKHPLIVPQEKKSSYDTTLARAQMWYDNGVKKYEIDSNGDVSNSSVDADVYNGHEYKWSVTFYQLEKGSNENYILPNDPRIYDMTVTRGTVLGSNFSRIHSVYTDEIYNDYFIQPVYIPGLRYDANKPEMWTYDSSKEIEQRGVRAAVKGYDQSYGYIYMQTGDNGFKSTTITPEISNGFQVFKYGNDIDTTSVQNTVSYVINDVALDKNIYVDFESNKKYFNGDIVLYADAFYKAVASSTESVPSTSNDDWENYDISGDNAVWKWNNMLSDSTQSYGELVYDDFSSTNSDLNIPIANIKITTNERIILNHQETNGAILNNGEYVGSPYNGIYYIGSSTLTSERGGYNPPIPNEYINNVTYTYNSIVRDGSASYDSNDDSYTYRTYSRTGSIRDIPPWEGDNQPYVERTYPFTIHNIGGSTSWTLATVYQTAGYNSSQGDASDNFELEWPLYSGKYISKYDSSTTYTKDNPYCWCIGTEVYDEQQSDPYRDQYYRYFAIYKYNGNVIGVSPPTNSIIWSGPHQQKSEREILPYYRHTLKFLRTPDADTWGELSNKLVLVTSPNSDFYGKRLQTKGVNEDLNTYGTINETQIIFIPEKPMEIYLKTHNEYNSNTSYEAGDIVLYAPNRSNVYEIWASGKQYKYGEIVYTTNDGFVESYYMCVEPNIAQRPDAGSEYWKKYTKTVAYTAKQNTTGNAPILPDGTLNSDYWDVNNHLNDTGLIFYNKRLGEIFDYNSNYNSRQSVEDLTAIFTTTASNTNLSVRDLTRLIRIDWGDETIVDIPDGGAGSYSHTYAEAGTYEAKFYGVTKIGENATTSYSTWSFYGARNSLTSVTIGNSVTSIGSYAFEGCSGLKSITIPDSVTSIGNSAFYDCSSLSEVTIPDSVTSIGGYGTFFGCSGLTSVTIGNSVTSIGKSAFYNCSSLSEITIGNSVMSIGNNAFYNCSGLTTIYYLGTRAQFNSMGVSQIGNTPFENAKKYYLRDGLLYIRRSDNISNGMMLLKDSTTNEQHYIKIQNYNPTYGLVEYDIAYDYDYNSPYSTSDPKNPSSTDEELEGTWISDAGTNVGTKYQIKTFFRESNDELFSLYDKPSIDISLKTLDESSLSSDEVYNPDIVASATYNQNQFIQWKDAQWFLYKTDANHSSEFEILVNKSDILFDKVLSYNIYGLEPESHYNLKLVVETYSGYKKVFEKHFETSFKESSNNVFETETSITFDCKYGCSVINRPPSEEPSEDKTVSIYKKEIWYPYDSSDTSSSYEEPIYKLVAKNVNGSLKDFDVGNHRYYKYLIRSDSSQDDEHNYYIKTLATRSAWVGYSLVELTPVKNSNGFTYQIKNDSDVWRFKYNIDSGSITQNLSRQQQDTLSNYPRFSQGPKNAMSGQVSCLIGRDIELFNLLTDSKYYDGSSWQFRNDAQKASNAYADKLFFTPPINGGGYKEKPWWDDSESYGTSNKKIDMLKKWQQFCYSGNPKLLKDEIGNSYIVQVFDNSMQPANTWDKRPITINFSWTEIEDIGKYQIIQHI